MSFFIHGTLKVFSSFVMTTLGWDSSAIGMGAGRSIEEVWEGIFSLCTSTLNYLPFLEHCMMLGAQLAKTGQHFAKTGQHPSPCIKSTVFSRNKPGASQNRLQLPGGGVEERSVHVSRINELFMSSTPFSLSSWPDGCIYFKLCSPHLIQNLVRC